MPQHPVADDGVHLEVLSQTVVFSGVFDGMTNEGRFALECPSW
jgi:hypothetical protein